jgi:hypothetical protein
MGELLQNTSRSVTNMAEYLTPELIQRHFPHRFAELPPEIFLEHSVEERTPAGRLGRKATRDWLSLHSHSLTRQRLFRDIRPDIRGARQGARSRATVTSNCSASNGLAMKGTPAGGATRIPALITMMGRLG